MPPTVQYYIFDDKKVWFDVNSCQLGDFKVHEYNAKSIKAVGKEAERMKTDFELGSCVATISGARLKQTAKSLEDPNDWDTIEKMIERYMKDKIKHICVDYVVNYIKKCKEYNRSQRHAENVDDDDLSEENNDEGSSQPRKRKVWRVRAQSLRDCYSILDHGPSPSFSRSTIVTLA